MIPQLSNPQEDARVESLFDALQSPASGQQAVTSKAKAESLYDAITDKKHGILSWLKQRW